MAMAILLHRQKYRDDRIQNKKDKEKKNKEESNEASRNEEETEQGNSENSSTSQTRENGPTITAHMNRRKWTNSKTCY